MSWHADRREWDRLAEVFADPVPLDHTGLNDGEPARLTPAQIVEARSGLLGRFDTTRHLVAGHLVTVDGRHRGPHGVARGDTATWAEATRTRRPSPQAAGARAAAGPAPRLPGLLRVGEQAKAPRQRRRLGSR